MTRPWMRRIAGRIASALPLPAPFFPVPGAPTGGATLSHRLGTRLQNSRFASSAPGRTLATLIHLDAEPTWIRLLHVNDGPAAWTIDAAAIAPTAALGDGVVPVGAGGRPDLSAWRSVTYAAAGRESDPGGRSDGPRSMTVPGNDGDPGCPVQVLSDWMPVQAVPRRDGGFGFLLLVRTFAQGGIRYAASRGRPHGAIGRLHRGFWAEGHQAGATPEEGSDKAFVPDDTAFACHGVQWMSPTHGATVLGIGDSIMNSSCTTGELSGYGIRACTMISTPRRPVSYVNEGFPGRNSLGFCASGAWALRTFRPQVALLQAWTPNEDWTVPQADVAFGRAMAVVDLARQQGCVPVLTTAAPTFHDNLEAEAGRQASNDRVRQVAASQGLPLLDLDGLWGTGSMPNAYRLRFDAGDRFHPNDRACATAAAVLAPMLERLLAQA